MSNIEWTDRTWNPVIGCTPDRLGDPLKWRKPAMVRVPDLFDEGTPFEYADKVFAVMALCPRHTFQVLTKRPERMADYLNQETAERIGEAAIGYGEEHWPDFARYHVASMRMPDSLPFEWPLPNVWLGTSVERQQEADERIPHLLKCPAAVRFLSVEPLLGPVDLSAFFGGPYVGLPGDVVHQNYNFGINWVIVGGESGPGARPCDVAWIESIIDQCRAAAVPCFVKQFGSVPMNGPFRQQPVTGRIDSPVGGNGRRFKDRKGADPSEWPENFRVRQMPGVKA